MIRDWSSLKKNKRLSAAVASKGRNFDKCWVRGQHISKEVDQKVHNIISTGHYLDLDIFLISYK